MIAPAPTLVLLSLDKVMIITSYVTKINGQSALLFAKVVIKNCQNVGLNMPNCWFHASSAQRHSQIPIKKTSSIRIFIAISGIDKLADKAKDFWRTSGGTRVCEVFLFHQLHYFLTCRVKVIYKINVFNFFPDCQTFGTDYQQRLMVVPLRIVVIGVVLLTDTMQNMVFQYQSAWFWIVLKLFKWHHIETCCSPVGAKGISVGMLVTSKAWLDCGQVLVHLPDQKH